MRHRAVVLGFVVLIVGCATHATRSVMQVSAGEAPRVAAVGAFEELGYEAAREPPTADPRARENTLRAWRWWPGSLWWERGSGVRPTFDEADPISTEPPAYWVRLRDDGGWDQLAVSTFRGSSGGGIWTGQPHASWGRWVVNAGTFGPDGKERWPSAAVRADADSVIRLIWKASRRRAVAIEPGS